MKDACKSLLGVNLNRTNQEEEAESPLVPYYSSRNMKFFLVAELFRNGASEQANLLCKHLGHTGPFRDPDILDAYLDHVLEFLLPFSLGLKSTRIFHSESMDLDGTFHHFMDEEDIVKLKTMLDNVPIYLWKKPKVFSLICRILAESFDAKGNNQIVRIFRYCIV